MPNAQQILIHHYKDVFNNRNINYNLQKKSTNIILALKKEKYLYEGSHHIQDQGQKHFYYSPIMLNCAYDCKYCFLQGMYPSGNIVIFVNIEDFFVDVEEKTSLLPEDEKLFLSISYDTDLLALEKMTGITNRWIQYSQTNNKLNIEVRTKSANISSITNANKNVLFTWTLSPQVVIEQYEMKTPSLIKRLEALNKALDRGYRVGIVIDPLINIDDFENIYSSFMKDLKINIDLKKIEVWIIGTFRISTTQLKEMKNKKIASDIIYYPYTIENQTASYSKQIEQRLLNIVLNQLKEYNTALIG